MDTRKSFYDKCFKDKEGRISFGQEANLPIKVAVVSVLIALIPISFVSSLGIIMAFGAFFTWSWLELFDGVNYFRRALGAISLLALIAIVFFSKILNGL